MQNVRSLLDAKWSAHRRRPLTNTKHTYKGIRNGGVMLLLLLLLLQPPVGPDSVHKYSEQQDSECQLWRSGFVR